MHNSYWPHENREDWIAHWQQRIEDDLKRVPEWLIWRLYWYGWTKCRLAHCRVESGETQQLLLDHPDYSELSLKYYIRNGPLRAYILFPGTETSKPFQTDFYLLSGDDLLRMPLSVAFDLIERFEAMVSFFMPGIRIDASYRECQSGFHEDHPFTGNAMHTRYVTKIGERWVCETCESRLLLSADTEVPADETRKQASEREKMSVRLRFEILERDGFTCRACGRNAREDGVKLHVDHIIPIAKGGLTEPDNLHTLCQDCNLGKRADIVEQMSLW